VQDEALAGGQELRVAEWGSGASRTSVSRQVPSPARMIPWRRTEVFEPGASTVRNIARRSPLGSSATSHSFGTMAGWVRRRTRQVLPPSGEMSMSSALGAALSSRCETPAGTSHTCPRASRQPSRRWRKRDTW
jgi:hypothetical protein